MCSWLSSILRRILCSHTLILPSPSSDALPVPASTNPLDSSPSFLDLPAFFELENDDFLLLTFGTREKIKTHEIVLNAKLSRKNNKYEDQEDCSSQNSSPVSVLDFDLQLPKSEECTIRRRKLWSTLEDYNPLCTQFDEDCVGDEHNSSMVEESCPSSRNKFCHTQHYFQICRMSETQVLHSNWEFHDLQDICAYFELGILDELLHELIDQLHLIN